MKCKFKVGDTVQVVAGKFRYRPGSMEDHKQVPTQGRIVAINKRNQTVIIEDVNKGIFHERRTRQENGEFAGGRVERERPIHLSNVMFVDPQTQKPVRLGVKVVDGRKVRFTKGRNASGAVIDEASD